MIMMIITMIMTSKMNLFDGERCLMTGRLEHSRGGISTSRLLPSRVCFHQDRFHQETVSSIRVPSGDCFHRETASFGELLPSEAGSVKTGSIRRLFSLGDCFLRAAGSIKTGSFSKSSAEAGSIWTLHQYGSMGEPSTRQFHGGSLHRKPVPCIGRGSTKTGSISKSSAQMKSLNTAKWLKL